MVVLFAPEKYQKGLLFLRKSNKKHILRAAQRAVRAKSRATIFANLFGKNLSNLRGPHKINDLVILWGEKK